MIDEDKLKKLLCETVVTLSKLVEPNLYQSALIEGALAHIKDADLSDSGSDSHGNGSTSSGFELFGDSSSIESAEVSPDNTTSGNRPDSP